MNFSQNVILDFPPKEVIEKLLKFMITPSPNNNHDDREKIESDVKDWLQKTHEDAWNEILFIDFALCQIENASEKYFFISNSDNDKGLKSDNDKGLKKEYNRIIKCILKANQGVAINWGFTSGIDISQEDYPNFSGVFFHKCNDSDDDIPECFKGYSQHLKDLSQSFGLTSWCAIPVNVPSQTGIYNLAQIFIGFKKLEAIEKNPAISAMIKTLISLICYLSHWHSNEIKVIEDLSAIGTQNEEDLSAIGTQNEEDLSAIGTKNEGDQSYFQERLSTYLKQFKNLLLVRIALMPNKNANSQLAYNFVLSKIITGNPPDDALNALNAFNADRERAHKDEVSITKSPPNETKICEFSTDLIPYPGICKSEAASRGTNPNQQNKKWELRWEEWKKIRNREGGQHATMLFMPDPAENNETYVYAEFRGTQEETETQRNVFTAGIKSVIDNTKKYLELAEANERKITQMKKLFSDLMRTTRTIDVFARMFAISLDAFDDFKDFREKLGFISYEFLSQDKRNFSFVLVPKQSQGTGYYYSNYEIPDNSCTGKKYFEVYKKSGSNNDVEECFEVKKCFDELVNAWGRSQLTDCSTHLFQHVIFADINENDNTENSSSDENVRNYKNTIASIINEHSISRAIKKNKPNPQGEWLGFAPEVATKDHKLTYTYRPYAYWNKKCAVVSGFRNDNDLRMIIMIGMKEDYFTEDDNATIKGLIEKIWEHQLRYLAESTLDSFTNIERLNKFAKIFENLKRGTPNEAHPREFKELGDRLIASFEETRLFPIGFFKNNSPYLNFYKALSGPYPNRQSWNYANYMLGYNSDSGYNFTSVCPMWTAISLGYNSDSAYNFTLGMLSTFLKTAIGCLELSHVKFTPNEDNGLILFPCYCGYEFIHKLLKFLRAIDADCKTYPPEAEDEKITVSVEYDKNKKLVKIRLKGLANPVGLITKTAGSGCSGAREELRYCSSAGQVPVVAFACEGEGKKKDFLIVWYSAVSCPQAKGDENNADQDDIELT